MTAENMALRRAYWRNHPHAESPESRKKSNRKYRISSYGLSQEQFDRLLAARALTDRDSASRDPPVWIADGMTVPNLQPSASLSPLPVRVLRTRGRSAVNSGSCSVAVVWRTSRSMDQ